MGDWQTADLMLREAHSTLAVHRPYAGAPWRKVCPQCSDSDCPALTQADRVVLARTRPSWPPRRSEPAGRPVT